MVAISSQDFRNIYEKLYSEIRRYLWPYQVLECLAEIETNIYSAFVDIPKLQVDFAKLRRSMKETMLDDKALTEDVESMQKLLDEVDVESYLRLPRVNETDPEKNKSIKTITDEKEDAVI